MPKQKRDYEELKKEFMKSDFMEVTAFMHNKGLTTNSEWRKRTKGWTKEKREAKEKTIKRAIDKSIERNAEIISAQIDPNKLSQIKQMIFDSVYEDVERIYKSAKKDYRALDTYAKMTKVELNEPTSFIKSENDNTNTEKIESINIVREKPKEK